VLRKIHSNNEILNTGDISKNFNLKISQIQAIDELSNNPITENSSDLQTHKTDNLGLVHGQAFNF
jgi:hypothetical protein